MIEAFLHGFLLALGLILPLGVQNVFIFSQGATQPKLTKALPAVVVASLADTALILLAVMGVSVMVLTIWWFKTLLISVGVIFLLYMGWLNWTRPAIKNDDSTEVVVASETEAMITGTVQKKNEQPEEWSIQRQVVFALSVSLLNPHAILDTIGVIGTNSLQYLGGTKVVFTAACIAVSWVWFFSLALVGRTIGVMDGSGHILTAVNRLSAVIMWASAIYLVISYGSK